MLTLPTKIATEAAAAQSAWAELYDFYLREAIVTPWGTTNVIRISSAPGEIAFFTPVVEPEPSGTQGDPEVYHFWPVKRKLIKSQSKAANDKLSIVVSNVTAEWAGMLAAIDWYDVPVVIRKVATSATGLAATDCLVIFQGQIDSARVTLEQLQFTISSNLANFASVLPAYNMHAACRHRWGDDLCTAVKWRPENRQVKTVDGSATATTTSIPAAYAGYTDESVTADATTNKIGLVGHTLLAGHGVRFGGSTVPGGLTAGRWYYVVNAGTDDFQVALTRGGAAIDLTSAGSSVTMTSEKGFTEDTTTGAGPEEGGDTGADGDITGSSYQSSYEPYWVKTGYAAGEHWRISSDASNPTPGTDIYSPYITFDFGTVRAVRRWEFDWQSLVKSVVVQVSTDGVNWVFAHQTILASIMNNFGVGVRAVTMPQGATRYWRLICQKQGAAAWFAHEILAKTIVARLSTSGADLVEPLADGAITTSSEVAGFEGYRVQTSYATGWKINAPDQADFGLLDWGNNLQGYWQIPDAQAGLKNALLKPWIQFDFGEALRLGLWRIKHRDGVDRTELPRLIEIFSSSDESNWTFEGYFELPPVAGGWASIDLPSPGAAQYWRICIRSLWGDQMVFALFNKITAYAGSMNYWAHGRVTFDAATATAGLRGVSRRVLSSVAGAVTVEALPVAPAAGDAFVVERGCPGTFNACALRGNTENYGGFDSLPSETIVR
jgi:hypothetical protein